LRRWRRYGQVLGVDESVNTNKRRRYSLNVRINRNECLELTGFSATKLMPHDAQAIEGMLHSNHVNVLQPALHSTHISWPETESLKSFLPVAHDCHVIPKAFIAAVIGSEKNTGSTRSTMSPDTSRKFRLFSSGISALRAPLSIATCNGSAKDRIALMLP